MLTKTLLDDAIPHARYDLLFYIFIALVALHLGSTGLGIIKTRMATRVSCRVTYDLREQMFRQLQAMSVSYYDKNQVGSLMARITRDTEELQSFITQITTGIFFNILTIIGVGCMLLYLDWRLCLYVVLPWPFVVFGTLRFWKNMVPRIKRLIYARWRISAGLNSTLSGIRVVKAFAQEEHEEERFRNRNAMVFESNVDVQNYWNTYYPLITFFFPVGGFLVWYLGGREAANNVITIGSLVAFISLLGRFQAPLMALTQTSNQMTRFLTAAQRIFEILDQTPDISDDPEAVELDAVQGEVEFKNVSFGYLPNQLILQDVSFRLRPGEMLGIIGPSGAGKTTLINLICRFYDTDEGHVLVDGVDVRKITKDSLRKHIGLVLQEPFLFRGTIGENIAYGKPDATREEIIRAAKAANAHEFIVKLPEGYDT
ncbi:MAG TPA: ABC transporter ATP-binding protein, partial [bacterium]|nr:ABC transporter ATP-binding protein [bacterium]